MDAFIGQIQAIRDLESAKACLARYAPHADVGEIIAFVEQAHAGQFRKSGEPYVIHPVLVAAVTARFGGDEAMVKAALLHDVVEDTRYSHDELETMYGEDVVRLVDGLTKIDEIREHELPPSESEQKLLKAALSFRKMLTHAVTDPRVLVIKLCDRLHNLLTLDALSPAKQKRIAEESLVVYAPIAHRLGISAIKNTIEDISFSYLFPEDDAKIDSYLEANSQKIVLAFNSFQHAIEGLLAKNGFTENEVTIKSRIKHKYSIFLKMQRKGISIEEVLDLLALRIIVKEPLECYKILGLLHQHYKPLISRFKDYIAIPKENGYQTIHTTLFYDHSIFEVQIRTRDMDKIAEYGIAAHWEYKAGGTNLPGTGWLKNLAFGHESVEEFYELAKNDLFMEDIYVYSPKGDVFSLPRDATVLDFAYMVHSAIGNKAVEAYVNKQRVPLLHSLKSGDICSIVTGEKEIARCSWIAAVKTSRAKVAMKSLCTAKSREIDRRVAKNILALTLDFNYDELKEWLEETRYADEVHKLIRSIEIYDELVKKIKKESNLRSKSLLARIAGTKPRRYVVDSFTFYSDKAVTDVGFDLCCHPKKGDEIIAFYNKGKAIIHHKYCTHADDLIAQHLPMLYVRWSDNNKQLYKVVVSLENKKGQLAQFVSFLAKEDVNISYLQVGESGGSKYVDLCEIEIELSGDPKRLRDKIAGRYKLIDFLPKKDAYKGAE